MPALNVTNIATASIKNMVEALRTATIGGELIFSEVSTVNDVESFLRTSGKMDPGKKPELGIVTGSAEERQGTSNFEVSIIRMPFDLVVRFLCKRRIGDDESDAMALADWYIEAAKQAIMFDSSRGGNCNLVEFGADVINGTSIYGFARPVVQRGRFNEAFFAAAVNGAIAWSRH